MSEADSLPDSAAARRAFQRAAATYDDVAVLQREVGERLIERFELIRLQPEAILDIGAGTGHTTRRLMDRYRRARFCALDPAPAMLATARRRAPKFRRLRCVSGVAETLPFADDSFDAVFSNLAYQWVNDLPSAFAEVQRVLRPGGVFMFTSLGPDTLTELRDAWARADDRTHVNRFVDMHDVGDALARARLAEPVMDMEYFTLTYPDVRALMRDLKALGAHNVTRGRARALTPPARLRAMADAYERHRDADGRLPATWEVVYGHAWGTGNVFRPGERATPQAHPAE